MKCRRVSRFIYLLTFYALTDAEFVFTVRQQQWTCNKKEGCSVEVGFYFKQDSSSFGPIGGILIVTCILIDIDYFN